MTERETVIEDDPGTPDTNVLSFRPPGRPLNITEIEAEYVLMRDRLKAEEAKKAAAERLKAAKEGRDPNPVRSMDLTPEIARRVCEKSGTHLLKLVSPRADGDHAILSISEPGSNRRKPMIPSVNAADIPFAKVLYRPLEIIGSPTRSLVDHLLNPDDLSDRVCDAFAAVFGAEVLEAASQALSGAAKPVTKLAAGEFPIIFLPDPNGGDIQVTPVSPATAFMGMKSVISPFFKKQEKGGPKVPRGRFHKQSVSAQIQNISGAIGGQRVRLLAETPAGLEQAEAELHRYVRGGSFPRWREAEVDVWVLRYAEMLAADETYNDRNTRAALDRTADRLIRDADRFVVETVEDARDLAKNLSIAPDELAEPPGAGTVLLRRRWESDDAFQRARRALSSAHFEYRLLQRRETKEG